MTQEELEQEYPWRKQPEYQAVRRLDKIPESEYPRLWNELNHYIWPEELGEIPGGVPFEQDKDSPVAYAVMSAIESSCGEKACLRYAHKMEGATDQMFEDWWDSRHDPQKLLQCVGQALDARAHGPSEELSQKTEEETNRPREQRRYYRNLVLSTVTSLGSGLVLSALFKALGFSGLLFGGLLVAAGYFLAVLTNQ